MDNIENIIEKETDIEKLRKFLLTMIRRQVNISAQWTIDESMTEIDEIKLWNESTKPWEDL